MSEVLSSRRDPPAALEVSKPSRNSSRGQAFILYGNLDTLSLSRIADSLAEVLLAFDL